MAAFLRIKLLEVIMDHSKPNDPFCAVNIKEATQGDGGQLVLQQHKKTFYPEWNRCFDSHLKPGRRMQIFVHDKADVPGADIIRVAEVTVETESLAQQCEDDCAVKIALDLRPSGKIIMQIKQYGVNHVENIVSGSMTIRSLEKIEGMPKNATALRGRTGAVYRKKAEEDEIKGHVFLKKYFRQPTYCSLCHEFLWGFNKKGYQCTTCHYTSHKRCLDTILAHCTGATGSSTHSKYLKERFKIDVPHRFKNHTFLGPTFCDMCGQLMHGIFKQQLKCDACGINCHTKCAPNMPNLCGVNEKMLSEALKSVDEVKKNRRLSENDVSPKEKKPVVSKPSSLPEIPDDYQEITEAMLTASMMEGPNSAHNVPAPTSQSHVMNGHRPLKAVSSSDPLAPPVPPRTYSQRPNGPTHSYSTSCLPIVKPAKPFSLSNFKFVKLLGKGSFGKVLLAQEMKTKQYYAIKALKKDVVLEDDDVEATMVEKRILALGTNYHYLTHLHSTFTTPSHLFFVMEYLNGGDLMFHIQLAHKFKLPRARFYAAEILAALQFLHKHGIIYRDLKLDNILLDPEGHCKIADFGMCRENIVGSNSAGTFCGTPDYISPEIIQGKRYTFSVDFWSYGVLCYEMITGQSPFGGDDEEELFDSIQNSEIPFSRFLDRYTVEFLKGLLERDPTKRLGCIEEREPIRKHPFFRPIDWQQLEQRKLHPPYKPMVQGSWDSSNFDDDFTFQPAVLTPTDPQLVRSINQTEFAGFTYTSPEFNI